MQQSNERLNGVDMQLAEVQEGQARNDAGLGSAPRPQPSPEPVPKQEDGNKERPKEPKEDAQGSYDGGANEQVPENIDQDDKLDIQDQSAEQQQPSQPQPDLGESVATLAGDQKPQGQETLQKEGADVKVSFDGSDSPNK